MVTATFYLIKNTVKSSNTAISIII